MKNLKRLLVGNNPTVINIAKSENGHLQLSIPAKIKRYGLIATAGIAAFMLIGPVAGIFALATHLVFDVVLVGIVAGGVMIFKNKNVRKAFGFYFNSLGKTIAERVIKIEPLRMAELILEHRKDRFMNIGVEKKKLINALAIATDKKEHNEKLVVEKYALLKEAENKEKPEVVADLTIEIADILESNEDLEHNQKNLEQTIDQLNKVEEAARYELKRTESAHAQMVIRSEIVNVTHAALQSAQVVLDGGDDSFELNKAIEEHRADMAVKVAEIGQFGKSSNPFIERTMLEKESRQALAMERISSILEKKGLLADNSQAIKTKEVKPHFEEVEETV